MRLNLVLVAALLLPTALHAQFTLQDSHTTADLRGISTPQRGVAWASGTHGTILRTEDGGYLWQGCATPPGAADLDFRGIVASDSRTAVVMSSGTGPLSRVYRTADGCQSWQLDFTDPDPQGFFDTIIATPAQATVVGDAVNGKVSAWQGAPAPLSHWVRAAGFSAISAVPGEASFAASNAALVILPEDAQTAAGQQHAWLASQAAGHSFVHRVEFPGMRCRGCLLTASTVETPMGQPAASPGIFALAFRDPQHGIAVGGDYTKPGSSEHTAVFTADTGTTWTLANTPPHGYRSSVAYDSATKTWITVGPDGTDISRNDGRTWQPLRPGSTDSFDADRNWNALALPYVVGPHGRIGKLHIDALQLRSKP